jgi:AP2-associated kinase
MELADKTLFEIINNKFSKKEYFNEMMVLEIFYDILKSIEYLHNNKNILHRDIKIENILLLNNNNENDNKNKNIKYVLCDFGSCTKRIYKLNDKNERNEAEIDINENTTLSYRSPEMIDLFSGFQIDFKSDIW